MVLGLIILLIATVVIPIISLMLVYTLPPPQPVVTILVNRWNWSRPDEVLRNSPTNLQYDNDSEIKGFEDTHVMIFIGFGFLMTFLKKYCYSALGLNLVLAAFSIQWALLCQSFFHIKDRQIILTKKSLAEADIMSATVLITFGALLGFTSHHQIFFIAIVEIAVGCTNLYLIRDVFKAADRGGAMAIHMFGALFGIGASAALNIRRLAAGQVTSPRPEAEQVTSPRPEAGQVTSPRPEAGQVTSPRPEAEQVTSSSYFSDITAMIGTLFLWVYWPSFNAVLCKSSWEYETTVINTYLSLASSAIAAFSVSELVTKNEKFDMMHVQRSTLAGGVAVGSFANMKFPPMVAMVVGIVAAAISTLGYKYITPRLGKLGVLDTCGVFNVHGLPGVLSGLISVLITSLADNADYGKELAKQIIPNGGGMNQALAQLYALLTTIVVALAAGFATGLIARLLPSLKDEQKYRDDSLWKLPE